MISKGSYDRHLKKDIIRVRLSTFDKPAEITTVECEAGIKAALEKGRAAEGAGWWTSVGGKVGIAKDRVLVEVTLIGGVE